MFHEPFFLYAEVPNNNHEDEGNFERVNWCLLRETQTLNKRKIIVKRCAKLT